MFSTFWLPMGLLTLHVLGNLVWIGSILAVGLLMARASSLGEGAEAKGLLSAAVLIYSRLAAPAFGVAFLAGVGRVALDVHTYMHAHWFHGKLTVALIVIALHHVIGAKAKKAHTGSVQSAKSGRILSLALLCASTLTVLLVLFKAALVP
jgi:putative membrane protein